MLVGHDEGGESIEVAQDGTQARRSLLVDESDLGAGVLQAVVQLLGRPPCVEGDHDGTGQSGGPERHDPLGQIPHDDGDPVARFDPEGMLQAMGRPAWAWDVGLRGRPHALGNVAPVLGKDSGLQDFMGWLGANFLACANSRSAS